MGTSYHKIIFCPRSRFEALTMNLSRLKPNALQTIHPSRYLYSQARYLRTKSASKLRPLQGAFGIPGLPSLGDFGKQVKKEMKQKRTPLDQKIPVVPKFTDDEKPIKEVAGKSVIPGQSKGLREIDKDDIEANRRLQEQEKRLEEFERGKRENQGKSEQEIQTAGLDQGVEERPDNIVYPRDVIGQRFIKEKEPKIKVSLYDPLKQLLMIGIVRKIIWDSLPYRNIG
jgi:hypothetical protein